MLARTEAMVAEGELLSLLLFTVWRRDRSFELTCPFVGFVVCMTGFALGICSWVWC